MSALLQFVNNRKKELVQLYVAERQKISGRDGVLEVLLATNDKVDVRYVPIAMMNPALILEILEKKKTSEIRKDSLIYFYLCDAESSLLVEIDLEAEMRGSSS